MNDGFFTCRKWLSLSQIWPALFLAACVAAHAAEPKATSLNSGGVRGTVKAAPARVVRSAPAARLDLSGVGGGVYSTGLENIQVTITPRPSRATDPTYHSEIYVLWAGGKEKRHIGHNRQKRTVSLGRIPAGEVVVRIETGKDAHASGDASRNHDLLPHANVRQIAEGVVDVRMEDLPGLPEASAPAAYKKEHFFQDANLVFTGGVTSEPGLLKTLELLKDPNPEARAAAAAVLKTGYPKTARAAGLR